MRSTSTPGSATSHKAGSFSHLTLQFHCCIRSGFSKQTETMLQFQGVDSIQRIGYTSEGGLKEQKMDTKLTRKLVTKGKRWGYQSLRDVSCGWVQGRAVGTIVVLGEHPWGYVAATVSSQKGCPGTGVSAAAGGITS